MPLSQMITPCLWFDDQAEEAANFYVSVFDDSRIVTTNRYGDTGKDVHGQPAGKVMTVAFELEGQPFTALNGGPMFRFNEAVSLQVMVESQDDLDHYWERLSADGDEAAQQCGWLKDRYGLSWQVIPAMLPEWLRDSDPDRAGRVMSAMLAMKKIDVGELRRAREGD